MHSKETRRFGFRVLSGHTGGELLPGKPGGDQPRSLPYQELETRNSMLEGKMARIAGVDIPREKRVEISLCYIYGIGLTTSRKILEKTRINPDTRVRDLTEEEVNRLREVIDREHKVEGDLRREVNENIKRLIEIGCYRGMRHRRNLPVRGQRTRTNARTRRGPKRTVAGKKKAAAKK